MKWRNRTAGACLIAICAAVAPHAAHGQIAAEKGQLVVIDGVIVGRYALTTQALTDSVLVIGDRTYRGNDIDQVRVIRNEAATVLYGARAAEGAIVITTRAHTARAAVAGTPDRTYERATVLSNGVLLRDPAPGAANTPLLVVDGIVIGSDVNLEMLGIDATRIQRVEVTKGEAASKLYGARAANGVIHITLKPGG